AAKTARREPYRKDRSTVNAAVMLLNRETVVYEGVRTHEHHYTAQRTTHERIQRGARGRTGRTPDGRSGRYWHPFGRDSNRMDRRRDDTLISPQNRRSTL